MHVQYVRHGNNRDLKQDGQRRGSHQDDQGDCSDSGVDGRVNNSNAEMMINAIRPIRPCTFFRL
jgi:hypothetical protein